MSTPLKILIIDNTRDSNRFGSHQLVQWALRTTPPGSEVVVRRGPDKDFSSLDSLPDAIVISGSKTSCLEKNEKWIPAFDDFVIKKIETATPILGVCYGHQTLARCLFKMANQEPQLQKSVDAELGWCEISVTGESPLFQGLEKKFWTCEAHYEEVSVPPPGTRVFAESARCKIQAFEVLKKPIFGIQFHPEYGINDVEQALLERKKEGVRSDWILNAGKGSKLYNENVGKVIFGNFFKLAIQ